MTNDILNVGGKSVKRAQGKNNCVAECTEEFAMAVRFAAWKILCLLLVFISLAACSVAPMRKESITVRNTAGLSLPAQAHPAGPGHKLI